jgi:hypothetical protein
VLRGEVPDPTDAVDANVRFEDFEVISLLGEGGYGKVGLMPTCECEVRV